MKHIEFTKLVEKHEQRLSVSDEFEISAHLSECSVCKSEHGKLTAFFAVMASRQVEPVPQAVTARLLNIYQRKAVTNGRGLNGRSWLANLIFDDWQISLNERYTELDSRSMLFRWGEFDIDLRIELTGDKCLLTGQMFPARRDANVEITSDDARVTTTVNEFGEFTFDLLDQGSYDVRISMNGENILLENVPLHR